MGIFCLLFGSNTVEITTATPENLLSLLNEHNIRLKNVEYKDPLTIRFYLNRKDYKKTYQLTEKSGAKIKIIDRSGLYWRVKCLINRPVLVVGILLLFALTWFVPTKILFVQINGNEAVPTSLILEKAEFCGITFGASRRRVRSEVMKNQLLSAIPELQWVGVNTYGCNAVITVREKEHTLVENESSRIHHVVATKDGIISEMTVLRGAGNCKVGQAVEKGQILVSGYIDHGISLEATGADAEIIGYTGNILYTVTPTERMVRSKKTTEIIQYQLLIGKKLINFGKGSGISGRECVRMYKEWCLTLPGGFRLPVSIIQETTVPYSITAQDVESANDYVWLNAAAEQYLRSHMLSGEILQSNTLTEISNGRYTLYGTYQCREIIGRICSEEKMIADE